MRKTKYLPILFVVAALICHVDGTRPLKNARRAVGHGTPHHQSGHTTHHVKETYESDQVDESPDGADESQEDEEAASAEYYGNDDQPENEDEEGSRQSPTHQHTRQRRQTQHQRHEEYHENDEGGGEAGDGAPAADDEEAGPPGDAAEPSEEENQEEPQEMDEYDGSEYDDDHFMPTRKGKGGKSPKKSLSHVIQRGKNLHHTFHESLRNGLNEHSPAVKRAAHKTLKKSGAGGSDYKPHPHLQKILHKDMNKPAKPPVSMKNPKNKPFQPLSERPRPNRTNKLKFPTTNECHETFLEPLHALLLGDEGVLAEAFAQEAFECYRSDIMTFIHAQKDKLLLQINKSHVPPPAIIQHYRKKAEAFAMFTMATAQLDEYHRGLMNGFGTYVQQLLKHSDGSSGVNPKLKQTNKKYLESNKHKIRAANKAKGVYDYLRLELGQYSAKFKGLEDAFNQTFKQLLANPAA